MTNSHNNTIIKILKSILRWDVLSGIVAILSFSFAVSQHRHDQGGTLDVSYNTQRVYNNESKDIIILTDSEQITFNDIFPNFLNSDKYTLKDFTLSHTLESQGVLINNTGFYTNFQINDCSRVLKYTENILAPHQAAETPISSLLLGDETASCTIKSRATWDGAEKPFEFTVNSYLYHIPSHKNETFDLWRQRSWNMVKEKITSPIYDLVYLSSKGEEKREYNISLNNIYYSREDTKEIADNKETIKEYIQPKSANNNTIKRKHNELVKITNIDSTITANFKKYTFTYSSKSKLLQNGFIIYTYKTSTGKNIDGKNILIKPGSGEFEVLLYKDYTIGDYLGIAAEDASLEKYITIENNTLRNSHDSKYIGIYLREKTGNQYKTIQLVIEPRSAITYGNKNSDLNISEIHFFNVDNELLEQDPDLIRSETKSIGFNWGAFFGILVGCALFVLLLYMDYSFNFFAFLFEWKDISLKSRWNNGITVCWGISPRITKGYSIKYIVISILMFLKILAAISFITGIIGSLIFAFI